MIIVNVVESPSFVGLVGREAILEVHSRWFAAFRGFSKFSPLELLGITGELGCANGDDGGNGYGRVLGPVAPTGKPFRVFLVVPITIDGRFVP